MGDEHIVEDQDIALVPLNAEGLLTKGLSDLLQHGFLNCGAVTVGCIARQILIFVRGVQCFSCSFVQAGRVKQMRLIEPNSLAGPGMSRYGITDLPRSQVPPRCPLESDVMSGAILLDFPSRVGLEYYRPG